MMDLCWWHFSLKPVHRDQLNKRSAAVKKIPGPEGDECDMNTVYETYRDKVNHPNIERIVARPLRQWDHQWHIPMEWICGEKLYKVMFHPRSSSIKLTPDITSRIITGLCEGLLFLHNHDIAHQDIHPKNIMVDSENCRSVIIGVFNHRGLRAVKERQNVCYAAPESSSVRGQKCSDVWALGKVIYELLVGYEITKTETNCDAVRNDLSQNIYREPVAAMVERSPIHRTSMEGIIDYIRAAESKVRATRSLSGPSVFSPSNTPRSYGQDALMLLGNSIRHDLPPFRLPDPLPHAGTVKLRHHSYDRTGRRVDIMGELRTRNGAVLDLWWTVCEPNGADSDEDDRLCLEY